MQLLLLFFIQIYTLFQLDCISINKKIRWQTASLFLWVGAFSVAALTLIAHLITTRIVPPNINAYALNPLVEESLTLLPILLIAWKSSLRQKLGVLDWMLLCGALGLGFGLTETGLRIIGSAQEWNLHQASWSHFGMLIFSWLPERLHEGTGYAGHGIAGALTGLGVGLWCKNRRLGGITFLILWSWAIFDHALSNFTNGSWFWEKRWSKLLWSVTGHGKFMPWALGVFILLIVLRDLKIHRTEWKNRILQSINALADLLSTKFISPAGWFQKKWNKKWTENTGKGRILFLLRIYFWLSLFLVFFCNGLLPRNFYHWYFQTPLWWVAGMIGIGFAVGALRQFLLEWRHDVTFAEPNAELIFWGRGFLCVGTLLFLLGSGANFVLTLNHHPLSDYFELHFLYYAFNTFLDFIRHGLSSALAVFAGLGGLISTAYAEADAKEDPIFAPLDPQNWNHVLATREGLVGHKTATGHVIQKDDIFVALPSRTALNKTVVLFYKGKTIEAPVLDVGPWNRGDPYWSTGTRPQSELGISVSERGTNKAGIDLSDKAFERLRLKNNDKIYWRFK